MRLHNICSQNKNARGFSLIEITLVLAILSTLLGMGLFVSLDMYRSYALRSRASTLVSLLEQARSRAINNFYQSPWGICLDTSAQQYVIFAGDTYVPGAPLNEATPSEVEGNIVGLPMCSTNSGIVFTQLSGTTTPATIAITESTHTTTISINYEGRIDW